MEVSPDQEEVDAFPGLHVVTAMARTADKRAAAEVRVGDAGPMGQGLFAQQVLTPGRKYAYYGVARTQEQHKAWEQERGEPSQYAFEMATGTVVDATEVQGIAAKVNHTTCPMPRPLRADGNTLD